MTGLPQSFWDDEFFRLSLILSPRLESLYMLGSKIAATQLGIDIQSDLLDELAIAWANKNTDEVLSGLMETSVEGTGKILSDWLSSNTATVGDLHKSLVESRMLYDADRASLISVTETTRAIASAAKENYLRNGITRWTWQTNNDEMIVDGEERGVCPICSSLNGKSVEIGTPFGVNKKGEPIIQPPDAHIGDRCWVTPVVEISKLLKGEAEGHPFRGNQYTDGTSQWILPSQKNLEQEYHVEEELKHLGVFRSQSEFLDAVAGGIPTEITPEIDASIAYRSRTKSKKALIDLISGYASWPKYRNKETTDNLYDRIGKGESMTMPIVLDYGKGRRRVFSGNTRMDVAFQLGINPTVLLVKVPLKKHMGPGDHPSGSPQSVHDKKHDKPLKEKARLRRILKFRGKNGERIHIEKHGNHWVIQIVDKEGAPLSKHHTAYTKNTMMQSGETALKDIEAGELDPDYISFKAKVNAEDDAELVVADKKSTMMTESEMKAKQVELLAASETEWKATEDADAKLTAEDDAKIFSANTQDDSSAILPSENDGGSPDPDEDELEGIQSGKGKTQTGEFITSEETAEAVAATHMASPVKQFGIKARIRHIAKYKSSLGETITMKYMDGAWIVSSVSEDGINVSNSKGLSTRLAAITYAEGLMGQLGGGPAATVPLAATKLIFKENSHKAYYDGLGYKVQKEASVDQSYSISKYVDGAYRILNTYSRTGINSNPSMYSDEKLDLHLKNIDSAFDLSSALFKENKLLFRGTSHSGSYPSSEEASDFWKSTIGTSGTKFFQDNSYFSASTSKSIASSFIGSGTRVFMTIRTPSGSRVLPISTIGGNSNEREMLFPRGTKFLVLDSKYGPVPGGSHHNVILVTLEAILP